MFSAKLGLKGGKWGKHLYGRCLNEGICPSKAQEWGVLLLVCNKKNINNHFLKRLLILYRIVFVV